MTGRSLAHYRITAAIGKGGRGEVYRATDTRLGRDVALKLNPAQQRLAALGDAQAEVDRLWARWAELEAKAEG